LIAGEYSSGVNVIMNCLFLLTLQITFAKFILLISELLATGVSIKRRELKPEQYGDGQSNVTTDIYCFGVTMFQLITGKLPQELRLGIKLPGHFSDDMPPRIEEIISKCTRFNPEERYGNVRELKDDLLSARNQLTLNKTILNSGSNLDNELYEINKMYSNINNNNYFSIYSSNNTDNSYNSDNNNDINNSNIISNGSNSNSTGNNSNISKAVPDSKSSYIAKNKISKLKYLFTGNLSLSKNKKTNRIPPYKSMIITVWDNTEFACELAYVTAKLTSLNILIADIDLLCPIADLMLNIKKYPEKIIREGILNESGLNIVLDSAAKGTLTRESFFSACIKRKEAGNLYILTGNYRLENYEYYSNESLTIFIDKSSQIFDVVILAVNKSIYDAFTMISLIKSDINIIPVYAVVHKLREFNNYIVFLKDKQKIPLDKNKFVAYEYNNKIHLLETVINEATQYNYLGSVRYCPQREKYRNQRIAYSQKMDKKVEEDYIEILRKINILQ
jgi:MinD-like ATPase involved in chromosome partitioning or flagellar assembly